MWRGALRFTVPMLWAVGLIYVFTIGGITGVMVASPPIDFQRPGHVLRRRPHAQRADRRDGLRDVRRDLLLVPEDDRAAAAPRRLGSVHFWVWIDRLHADVPAAVPAGRRGHAAAHRDLPGRSPAGPTSTSLSTVGAVRAAAGSLAFLAAVDRGAARSRAMRRRDPWEANSLEWATTSPPPHHNFGSLPPIRSERPVFDAREAARDADGPKAEDAT